MPALVKRAAAAYNILIQSRPAEALYRYRLANIYARGKRPEQAITLYRQALAQDPVFAAA